MRFYRWSVLCFANAVSALLGACVRVVFCNEKLHALFQHFYLCFQIERILKQCIMYAGSNQYVNQPCQFLIRNPQLRL